jgi:hypothetical protein
MINLFYKTTTQCHFVKSPLKEKLNHKHMIILKDARKYVVYIN